MPGKQLVDRDLKYLVKNRDLKYLVKNRDLKYLAKDGRFNEERYINSV